MEVIKGKKRGAETVVSSELSKTKPRFRTVEPGNRAKPKRLGKKLPGFFKVGRKKLRGDSRGLEEAANKKSLDHQD